jgi:hypothetical protein
MKANFINTLKAQILNERKNMDAMLLSPEAKEAFRAFGENENRISADSLRRQ